MNGPHVPFLNLRAQHEPIRAELIAAFSEVLDSSAFAGGPFVARFEQEFAQFCGTRHAVAVGNGTDALWLALLANGVGPGDEVITVAATFMATAEAITYTGARPVFVDIDPETYTMDPALLERAITPRTKAIIPVHLYGQVADMDPILEASRRHGIPVIEDACQAHGAEYKGKRAGAIGQAGCFSFYPGKNLGALGEGGAITTNDDQLAERMRILRDHGQKVKYHHVSVGWNCRMDGIQAAALSIKLRRLADGNEARRRHAAHYTAQLAASEMVITPVVAAHGVPVFHLYVVRVNARDRVLQALADRGISCGIHYPIPVHRQEAYAHLGIAAGALPVTEAYAGSILSLPMFPELTSTQVDAVCTALKAVLAAEPARQPARV